MTGIWNWPLGLIIVGIFAVMVAGHELGMWAHDRWKSRSDKSQDSSDEGFILSGVLGLLALLMAFSFSMSLDRFETRRELMLREASALGNLELVSKAAAGAGAKAIGPLLQDYAQARLKAVEAADGTGLAAAQRHATTQRGILHQSVERAVVEHAGQPVAIALATAFDELEDSAVRRGAMAAAHLPEMVLWLLTIYCIFSAVMLGYAVAASGSRQRVASTIFYLLLSMAFGVMLDIDRPSSGTITVPQEPFEEAVRALG